MRPDDPRRRVTPGLDEPVDDAARSGGRWESPVGDENLYAVTRRSLIDLSNSERGDATRDPRVTLLTYVG